MYRLARFFFLACFACCVFSVSSSRAATLVYMGDELESQLAGDASNHALTFITPSGIDTSTDTVTVTFPGFTLSSIVASDVLLSHGATGVETTETIAASSAAGVWGVSVAGSVLTLSPPTDAALGEVVASTTVRVLIGTNAGGVNRIVNPGTPDNYELTIGGGFGDTGVMGVAIVDNTQVAITASYPPPSGGGHPSTPDTTPPAIFNIRTSSTSPTSVDVLWQTDESSTSEVDYGHSNAYASGTVVNGSMVLSHVVSLTNLIPCRAYEYRVRSVDAYGNFSFSSGYSFTLACDTTAPIISSLRAEQVTDQSASILWSTNEPATSFVEYGTSPSYGSTASSMGFVTSHVMPIAGLLPGTTYYVRVTSVDASGNSATSDGFTFTTVSDQTPPANVSLTATPGNGFVTLLWSNPSDSDYAGVRIVRTTTGYPTSPLDGDLVFQGHGVGFVDTNVVNGTTYYYGAFAYDANGNFASGALASATPLASLPEVPPEIPPVIPEVPPTIPPTIPVQPEVPPTVPPVELPAEPTKHPSFSVQIFGSSGFLPLQVDRNGVVNVLSGSPIVVRAIFPASGDTPSLVAVVIDGYTYQLSYRPDYGWYEGTFIASESGDHSMRVEALYSDRSVSSINIPLRSVGYGFIFERSIIGDPTQPIDGATIRLYRQEGGSWVLWSGAPYGQTNPQTTGADGRYVFLVPQGLYYAEVERNGYVTVKTDPVFIDTNVFHQVIELTRLPLTPEEILQGRTSSVTNIIGAYAQSFGDVINFGVKQLQAWLETKDIQDTNQQIIAPAALAIGIANAAGALSAFQVLTYLQYLFTQPFLLLWRRKRKAYGMIYHSITKRPIDLAIVRWISEETGLTVRTAVTDRDGRYFLHSDPGTYRLEVVKQHYEFPSSLLRGLQTDGEYLDIYSGGVVELTEPATVAINVPLDPMVAVETPRRVIFSHFMRIIQHGVALFGVVVSVMAFLITPSVPMALFVLVQIGIYSIFRRLSLPARPHEWGIIADAQTRRPIVRAIVRLYDQVYDRLLETYVTDGRGRYGFLVGKNVYKVVVQAKGYRDSKLEKIDATKKKETVIRVPIHMDPEDGKKSEP